MVAVVESEAKMLVHSVAATQQMTATLLEQSDWMVFSTLVPAYQMAVLS